jgi:hypothetical protein
MLKHRFLGKGRVAIDGVYNLYCATWSELVAMLFRRKRSIDWRHPLDPQRMIAAGAAKPANQL